MALQMKVKSTSGLEADKAYIKIDQYSCDKNNLVSAVLNAYVSKEVSLKATPIEGAGKSLTFYADYSDESVNSKKQIYDFAKTLDYFRDSIDV